jgi:transcriptional regulator of arginine metabolism
MTTTQARREAIRKIIEEQPVATQNDLVQYLMERGIAATQSSISRDISHLGLIKAGGRYIIPSTGNGRAAMPISIRHAVAAEALAIVKVSAGQAAALGVYLDQAAWPEVVGTVAGDDTLIIACRDRMARNAVLAKLTTSAYTGPEQKNT